MLNGWSIATREGVEVERDDGDSVGELLCNFFQHIKLVEHRELYIPTYFLAE